jgi:hypothetical protein
VGGFRAPANERMEFLGFWAFGVWGFRFRFVFVLCVDVCVKNIGNERVILATKGGSPGRGHSTPCHLTTHYVIEAHALLSAYAFSVYSKPSPLRPIAVYS